MSPDTLTTLNDALTFYLSFHEGRAITLAKRQGNSRALLIDSHLEEAHRIRAAIRKSTKETDHELDRPGPTRH